MTFSKPGQDETSTSALTPEDIREHLEEILRSKAFEQSSRSSRFLRFVVDEVLAGRGGRLKETALGIAVFDREPTYDPKTDPVVRNAARRLRVRLEQYYAGEGASSPFRISLPKGGYAAVFEAARRAETEEVFAEPETQPEAAVPVDPPAASSVATASTVATTKPRGMAMLWISLTGLVVLLLCSVYVISHVHPTPRPVPPHSEPLTTYRGQTFQPAISPDGKQVAFVWDGNADNYDIYVKSMNSRPVRLTTNAAHDLHPAWSPDGQQIAFLRATRDSLDIMSMAALGGGERRIAHIQDLYYGQWEPEATQMLASPGPAWSADGALIAFTTGATQGSGRPLFLLSVQTGAIRQLTNPPGDGHDFYPAFSPDGRMIAFARYTSRFVTDLYVTPVGGGQERRLTSEHHDIAGLSWAGDNRTIVFSSNRLGSYGLWKISVDGSEPAFIPTNSRRATEPSVSKDGTWLSYTDSNVNVDLWRTSLQQAAGDGGGPERLISSSRQSNSPRYSPDGKKITFISDRSGNWEVWTANSDGSSPVQLTNFRGPWVGAPHWSPDSRTIAFDARPEGNSAIFLMNAEGGRARRMENNRFEEKMASWSHDGRYIYFNSNRGGRVGIWKFPVSSGASGGANAQLVCDHPAMDPTESFDGSTVYFLTQQPGIWKVSAAGGSPELVRGMETVMPGLDWDVTKDGILFIDQTARRDTVLFYHFLTGRITVAATLSRNVISAVPGLAASPDGRWVVYTQPGERQSDLMLLSGW